MKYIIYDLEATCWDGYAPNDIQEVIEIGAYKLDEYGEIEDSFCEFIKPVFNPRLSAFCTELTSITQTQVQNANGYSEVIEKFQEWIGYFDDENYLLCSWGGFDKTIFKNNCELHKIDSEWADAYINLKEQYHIINRLPRKIGLKKAIDKNGFEWEGNQHRGIDDAYNLTKIFNKYFDEWQF